MHFEDMNWMMLEDYLKKDNRVMVVLGMTEQHSHLSLLTDSLIPGKLADAASQQTGVVVAPTLHFGISPSFMAYPGTLSLKIQTYLKVIEELTRDLYAHGFRRILFLNGHGGNAPARTQLSELANELTDLQMLWYQWWTSSTVVEFSKAHNLPNQHANWEENFPLYPRGWGFAPWRKTDCFAWRAHLQRNGNKSACRRWLFRRPLAG